MPVCVNFNYPRANMSGNGAGPGTACGTSTTSKIKVIGAGFTPQPFTSLCVQRFPNGLDLSPATRPVDYTAQIDGTTAGWPHVAKGVAVPGAVGEEGVGFYILFGQIP